MTNTPRGESSHGASLLSLPPATYSPLPLLPMRPTYKAPAQQKHLTSFPLKFYQPTLLGMFWKEKPRGELSSLPSVTLAWGWGAAPFCPQVPRLLLPPSSTILSVGVLFLYLRMASTPPGIKSAFQTRRGNGAKLAADCLLTRQIISFPVNISLSDHF